MNAPQPLPLSVVGAAFCSGTLGPEGQIQCSLTDLSSALGCSEDDVWLLLPAVMKIARATITSEGDGIVVLSVFMTEKPRRSDTAAIRR